MGKTTGKEIDQETIDHLIEQVNHRLKVGQLGLQLERRGMKLSLRGILPPRPGSSRLKAYQQRLSLGLPTTATGIKQAERDAKIIAGQLLQNTFDWHRYLVWSVEVRVGEAGLTGQIEEFKRYFLSQPQRLANPASTQTTWESAYGPYLRKLKTIVQAKSKLSLPEAIYATVESFAIDSRSRQICCTALAAFGDFLRLELPIPLKDLAGSYNASKTQSRELPSDQEILSHFERIPNPTWRFVYGLMATYGLRNHEVFFCDDSGLKQGDPEAILRVLPSTKTGEHEVWPFLPEWVDRFQLRQGQLPAVNRDLRQTTLQAIGQRVTRQFQRYGIPFSPYDLRHAWAVRTIHIGLPDTVAAKMMGHSVTIHTRTYHRWITRRDQRQAVEAALRRYSSP
jgi:integrase